MSVSDHTTGEMPAAGESEQAASHIDELVRRLDSAVEKGTSTSEVAGFRWQLEVGTIRDNLVAAARALRLGIDPDRRPITPRQVGIGLGNLCAATIGDVHWSGPASMSMGPERWERVRLVLEETEIISAELKTAGA